MAKTAGGIFKAGAGCAGCGGLGAMTTGIFAGPTALGTALVSPSPRGIFGGLGAYGVPADCWDRPGYKAKHDEYFQDSQNVCAAEQWSLLGEEPPQSAIDACVTKRMDSLLPALEESYLCGGYAYKNPVTDSTPSGACNSGPVIMAVQGKIGTNVDGNWGPNSQAALAKSGSTFQQLAPGCTGPVPSSGGGGGYVAPVQPAQPYVPTVPATTGSKTAAPDPSGLMGFLTSKVFYLPMYAWLGAGSIALMIFFKKYQRQGPAYGSEFDTL
jgi:hypothetical protein